MAALKHARDKPRALPLAKARLMNTRTGLLPDGYCSKPVLMGPACQMSLAAFEQRVICGRSVV